MKLACIDPDVGILCVGLDSGEIAIELLRLGIV